MGNPVQLDALQKAKSYFTEDSTPNGKLSAWKVTTGVVGSGGIAVLAVGTAGLLGLGVAAGAAIGLQAGLIAGGALITAVALGVLFASNNPSSPRSNSKKPLKPSNNNNVPLSLPWNIKPNVMQKIQQSTPKLYQFLTNPAFKWNLQRDYDLGVEDNFGVLWISPQRDAGFLQAFRNQFQNDLHLLSQTSDQCRFSLNESSRLANNNIAELLHLGQKSPQVKEMVRNALCYCLSRI